MIRHEEKRILPHSAPKLFAMIEDVEAYPEFLPWVDAVRILERREKSFTAEMSVNFKAFTEKYVSEVFTKREELEIEVKLISGPFNHLQNRWRFKPLSESETEVEFLIEFEFSSMILEKIVGIFFDQAMKKMVTSFSNRANLLFAENGSSDDKVPSV